MNKRIKLLGICGSLRPTSSASAILNVVANLAPAHVDFEIYKGIGDIPAFDDNNEVPASVLDFINKITEADGVFFCIPEYAFGVPGALKNAIDWTVSTTAFSDKPVALITAASSGDNAHAAFLLTLKAIGTIIPEESKLLIPFIRTKLNEKNEVKDQATLESIKRVIDSLIVTIGQRMSDE